MEELAQMPQWLGTLPQWGMFFVVAGTIIVALIKMAPAWRQLSMTEADKLREELRICEDQCRAEIKALHNEIWGMRKQHITEQISLINVILKTVDAPELVNLLAVLESVKDHVAAAAMIGGDNVQGA